MSPAELHALLARLAPDLAGRSDWMLIGSAALMILGAPIADCADLDILTSEAGARRLEAAWRAWRRPDYAPDPAAPFRSRFSRYQAPEGAVEVMGGLTLRGADGWAPLEVGETQAVTVAGFAVIVPTLAEQLGILRRFGRPKDLAKAAVLEAWRAGG